MKQHKVTVILTSYNHAKYIKETIESVLTQTYKDFELIIWDDASTDESWEIIQNYDDTRIKVFRNEESKRGVYGINNVVYEIAQGEYIAIHHSDDIWEPTKLEKQIVFLESHPDIGAVFTNAMAINEEGYPFADESHAYYSIFDQPNRTRHEWLNFFFYQGNALCHPSVLIRKKCYDDCGLYRYGFAQLTDYDMWIRLCLQYEIHILPEKLVRFRVRDNEANSSGNTPEKRIRSMNEHFFISQNFCSITSWNDLIRVFPKATKLYSSKGCIPEYILAMMALEHTGRDIQLLGLTLLYKLMNDKEKALKVKEFYGLDYFKLSELSKKYDIFNQARRVIQLFYDQGNGFNEENSIKLFVNETDEIQEFIFALSDKPFLQGLRLDPLNDTCVIEIESLRLKKENEVIDFLPYIHLNAEIHHGKAYFFITEDPQIYFHNLEPHIFENVHALSVVLRYTYLSKDALHISIKQKNQELANKESNIQSLNKELANKESNIQSLNKELANKESNIHQKNLEIIQLIALAQSLRLKNRLKSMLKKNLPYPIIQILKAIKDRKLLENILERKKFTKIDFTSTKSDSIKNKIIVVSHDANKQGAPLLALYIVKHLSKLFNYDVVTILGRGGDLQNEFEKYSFVYRFDILREEEQEAIIKNLYKNNFILAICNTSVVGDIVQKLSLNAIYVVSLLHELPYVIKAANLNESIKKIINSANKIVFPSVYVKNQVKNLFKFDEDKIEVCHQGRYMTNEYKFDKTYAKRRLCKKLNIDENSNIVLNVGRGEYRKGLDLFIDTAIDVLNRVNNLYFVWVGKCDDEIYKDVLKKINENNCENRVLFIAFDENIGLYYSGSDLFYLSSREDPFPSVFIDAVSSSLPVVAYENGGGFTNYMEKINGTLIPNFDTKKVAQFIYDFFINQNFKQSYERQFENLGHDFGFNDYIFNILAIAGKTLPKVSVIVPNYNYEKYIEMRLNSIFNQTVKPYEIIFLDDNSTDNSVKIAEGLLEKSGFDYQIIANKTNKGCYNQWLKGIMEAKGDILWIAEADDLCKENFIAKLISKFEDQNISLAYAQSIAIDEHSNEMDFSYIEYTKELSADRWLKDFTNDGREEIINYLVKLNTIPNASGVLIRKTALENIGKHITKYSSTGDWFVYIYALQHGNIAFCSEKLNYHRRHSNSIIHRVMYESKLLKEIILISKYTYDNFDIHEEDIKLLVKRFNDYYKLLPNRESSLIKDKEFEEYFKSIGFEYFWKSYINS